MRFLSWTVILATNMKLAASLGTQSTLVSSCTNKCDDTGLCGDTCANLVNEYGCNTTYCDTCPYAGWCDEECSVGACSGPQPTPTPAPTSGPTCPYLLTKNAYSYVCSVDAVVAASNDTDKYSFGCSQQFYFGAARILDARASIDAGLTCPLGQTIQCFIYASYGNVAGSCSECETNQKCGSCQDCTAKEKCGYSDYGCFGNCVDCFGATCDPPGSGDVGCAAYFPEEMGAACIGQQSCYVQLSGTGQSAKWMSADGKTVVPVSDQAGVALCHGVDDNAKLKVLSICG